MFIENVKVAMRAPDRQQAAQRADDPGHHHRRYFGDRVDLNRQRVQAFINRQFEAQGSNLVFVFPARVEAGRGANRAGFLAFAPGARAGTALSLTQGDAEALRDRSRVPDARIVAPLASSSGQVIAGERKYQTRIRGTVPEYRELNDAKLLYGDYFTAEDTSGGARVVVLGDVPYRKLFPDGGDPTGQEVRINNVPFQVVGVLAQRAGGAEGSDDDVIVMPFTTFRERLFPQRNAKGEILVGIIILQAIDQSRIDAVIQQATELLRERHGIAFQDEDDFSISSQRDLLNTIGAVTGAITVFLAAIAGISLFVGGIGIMNIMLVSVTERTREIGLRKAIGARRRVILSQFLIESVLLSVLGGLVGIILGVALANLVALFSQGQFTAVVTADAIALATGFSVFVGIVFGVYPAWRAAKLNPIEALRYE
jgi:putative ABC transport system permease protein